MGEVTPTVHGLSVELVRVSVFPTGCDQSMPLQGKMLVNANARASHARIKRYLWLGGSLQVFRQ